MKKKKKKKEEEEEHDIKHIITFLNIKHSLPCMKNLTQLFNDNDRQKLFKRGPQGSAQN